MRRRAGRYFCQPLLVGGGGLVGAVSTCGEGSSVPADLFSDVRGGGQDLLSAVLEDDHLTIDELVVAPV